MLIGSNLYKTQNFETYDLVDNLSVFADSQMHYNFIKLDDRFVGGSRGFGINLAQYEDDFSRGGYYSFNGSDWNSATIINASWFNNETGNYFLDYNPEDNFIIRHRITEGATTESARCRLLYSIDKGESYAVGLLLSSGESFLRQTRIRYFKDNMFFSPNARGNNNPRVFSYDESNNITEVNVASPYSNGSISWEAVFDENAYVVPTSDTQVMRRFTGSGWQNISTPFDAHKVEYLDDLGGVLAVVGEDGLIAISNTGTDWQVLQVPEEFENKTFVYCESFRSRAAFYTDDGEILIS